MRVPYFLCLLFATLAHGQAVRPAMSPTAGTTTANILSPSSDNGSEASVGPDDPVITIDGFCRDPEQEGKACKTIISRAQFEKLTEALQPGMSLPLRLNVANSYARNLRMSAVAESRGLHKTPAFAEEMRFARMQLLSQDLSRLLQAEANNVTDADLADYYKRNQSLFEQATVARIFVPHGRKVVPTAQERQGSISPDARPDVAPDLGARTGTRKATEAQQNADEAVMSRFAADLRARAVSGEDPDKLQIEAYAEAGYPRTTPNTRIEKVRRSSLPPRHEKILDLNPGEVSQVFSDPGGGHFIYKMISKQTLSLEDVRTEIRTAISSQRFRDNMQSFQDHVVFSDAYFSPQNPPPPARNLRRRRKRPAAQEEQKHD